MQTVLLIDDDEQLAEPLREYFARYDLKLINEIHPERGLRRLKQDGADPISLVILDVMMPDMDGFEVCRIIRRDEQFKDLPVLILTARGEVMDRVIGLELGADDYLAKPFEKLSSTVLLLKRGLVAPTFTHDQLLPLPL